MIPALMEAMTKTEINSFINMQTNITYDCLQKRRKEREKKGKK